MDQIIADYSQQYRKELFESVVPFWMQHSPDTEYGGYYTCLDRRGEVYDTDKFMWLQGRQVWLCIAAMAFAQLNLATDEDEYGKIAVLTFPCSPFFKSGLESI